MCTFSGEKLCTLYYHLQYALIKKHGVSPAQITRLKRGESVSTNTIEMFCRILNCQVSDIMEYVEDAPDVPEK